jgi:uncharacterized membrane protein
MQPAMPSEGELDPPDALTPADVGRLPPSVRIGVGLRRMRVVPAVYSEGLLPSAQELAGYRLAARQAPQTILDEFAAEGAHRRRVELEIVQAENARANRGQLFALLVLLAGMALGGWLVMAGHDWAGTVVAGGNLVGMAALFLRVSRERARDRDSRDQDR